MTDLKPYPRQRVFWGLMMSPALVGLLIGLAIVCEAIFKGKDAPHFWYWIVLLLPFVGIATIWYGVPAAILGAVSVSLRFCKNFRACVTVFVLGGAAATLWSVLIRLFSGEQPFKLDLHASSVFPYIPALNDAVIFFAGALSSLIMALLVLPKRT